MKRICSHAGRKFCEPDLCAMHLATPLECEHEPAACLGFDDRTNYWRTCCVPVDSKAGKAALKRMEVHHEP